MRWEKLKTGNEARTYLRRTEAMQYSRCWQKRSGVLMFANGLYMHRLRYENVVYTLLCVCTGLLTINLI